MYQSRRAKSKSAHVSSNQAESLVPPAVKGITVGLVAGLLVIVALSLGSLVGSRSEARSQTDSVR